MSKPRLIITAVIIEGRSQADVARDYGVSRPNHPTTCGKVERFQQTLKKWLRSQPAPGNLAELQRPLNTFRDLLMMVTSPALP